MPGAETIVNTILSEAKEAAAKTLRDADERAQQLRANAAAAQKAADEAALQRANQEIAERKARARRMALLEARKEELADKRALIDQAFEGALDQLCLMDAEKKRALNRLGALEAAEGGETFCPAEGDAAALNQDFLAEVNRALAKAGKAPLLMGECAGEIRGGFLLKGEGVIYNCSYEALLSQARGGLEKQVAALLFDSAPAE
jgi:V/A-type H+-transporting ATPase subunit E